VVLGLTLDRLTISTAAPAAAGGAGGGGAGLAIHASSSTASVAGLQASLPKKPRKGHAFCFRVDLASADSAGVLKYHRRDICMVIESLG
jgi:hypothetical protein